MGIYESTRMVKTGEKSIDLYFSENKISVNLDRIQDDIIIVNDILINNGSDYDKTYRELVAAKVHPAIAQNIENTINGNWSKFIKLLEMPYTPFVFDLKRENPKPLDFEYKMTDSEAGEIE